MKGKKENKSRQMIEEYFLTRNFGKDKSNMPREYK